MAENEVWECKKNNCPFFSGDILEAVEHARTIGHNVTNGLFPELVIGLNKSDLKRAKLLELKNPLPKRSE